MRMAIVHLKPKQQLIHRHMGEAAHVSPQRRDRVCEGLHEDEGTVSACQADEVHSVVVPGPAFKLQLASPSSLQLVQSMHAQAGCSVPADSRRVQVIWTTTAEPLMQRPTFTPQHISLLQLCCSFM